MKKIVLLLVGLMGMAGWGAVSRSVAVEAKMREGNPTIMDVKYTVTSKLPRVKVRALAFQDGERSFAKVIRPVNFIEGTDANIGDDIEANVEHRLAWQVSSDWKIDLAKVKFEILSSDRLVLPGELTVIPAAGEQGEISIFKRKAECTNEEMLDGLFWTYASGNSGFEVVDGVVTKNGTRLADGASVADKGMSTEVILDAQDLVRMGIKQVQKIKKLLHQPTDLNSIISEYDLFYVNKAAFEEYIPNVGQYCVIDVSGGAGAESWPVSYVDAMPEGGWTDEYKKTKIVLKLIKPGAFKANYGRKPIMLTKPFYMGVFEITQKQYQQVMGSNPSYYKGDMRPVECVSWNVIRGDSNIYNWPNVKEPNPATFIGRIQEKTGLNFDLPTEPQWEYACRAGTTSDYNNGGNSTSDLRQLGRYDGNTGDGKGGGYSQHVNVGSYLPNAWGLYDMHGNVWEWCLDWYASWDDSAVTDPVPASSGSNRVNRGGSWYGSDNGCRSSYRSSYSPSSSSHYLGFRLSRTLVLE